MEQDKDWTWKVQGTLEKFSSQEVRELKELEGTAGKENTEANVQHIAEPALCAAVSLSVLARSPAVKRWY